MDPDESSYTLIVETDAPTNERAPGVIGGDESIEMMPASPLGNPNKEGDLELFTVHRQHRLRYTSLIVGSRYYCDVCSNQIDSSTSKYGMYSCRDCNFDMCSTCAMNPEQTERILPKESFDINLTILGGCWNSDLVYDDYDIKVEVQTNADSVVQAMENKEWTNSNFVINGKDTKHSPEEKNYLAGAITQPIKFKINNITIEKLSTLKLEIFVGHTDDKNPCRVLICKEFTEITKELQLEGARQRAVRYWHYVPLNSQRVKNYTPYDSRENFLTCKVPYLYAADDDLGFLNIECEVDGYEFVEEKISKTKMEQFIERDKFDSESRKKNSVFFIDDIEIVKMLVRNRIEWTQMSRFLTADVYTPSFEVYLSRQWRNLLPECIQVLGDINMEILKNEKPGNWDNVQTSCQEIVAKLLNNIPAEQTKEDGDVYKVLKSQLEPGKDDGPFYSIVKNELKVFSRNESFFNFVSNLWGEATSNLWPFPIWVAPSTLWKMGLVNFIVFLLLLTIHIYEVDQRPHILFYQALDDALGDFDTNITDFQSYTYWFNNTLIPALYDPSDNYLYLLTDQIIVRFIRVEPGPCINPEGVPHINEEVPLCYPRLTTTNFWSPSSWHNFTFSNLTGKPILSTLSTIYDSRGNIMILDRNQTIAEEQLSKIDFDTWLDWSIQAVIIEFAMYSPDLQLFAMCAVVGEFSNVGIFQGSHECAIISPQELAHSYGPTAILLYLFFASLFLIEMWELFLIMLKLRPTTEGEAKEASDNCQCCAISQKNPPCCDNFFEIYDNDKIISGETQPCCCSIPCYNYVVDIWNGLDIIMIFSGSTGLILRNVAANSMNTFEMTELWNVALILQTSNVFMSLCVVIAFFRFLDFLIPWEYIGVLVITVFYMMSAIVKFVILFVFISIGFSAAFHLLYDNSQIYSTASSSIITTSISIIAGYNVPDYSVLLFFPNSGAGYVFQVVCVIVGVVLLLNFLIAMMSTIYENIQDHSTEEYRWLMTREITQSAYSPWPGILFLLQAGFGMFACCLLCCNIDLTQHEKTDEESTNVDNDLKTLLYANMAISYFRESLGDKYDSTTQFNKFDDPEDEIVKENTRKKQLNRLSTFHRKHSKK